MNFGHCCSPFLYPSGNQCYNALVCLCSESSSSLSTPPSCQAVDQFRLHEIMQFMDIHVHVHMQARARAHTHNLCDQQMHTQTHRVHYKAFNKTEYIQQKKQAEDKHKAINMNRISTPLTCPWADLALELTSWLFISIISFGNVRFGRRPVIGGVSRDVTS